MPTGHPDTTRRRTSGPVTYEQRPRIVARALLSIESDQAGGRFQFPPMLARAINRARESRMLGPTRRSDFCLTPGVRE